MEQLINNVYVYYTHKIDCSVAEALAAAYAILLNSIQFRMFFLFRRVAYCQRNFQANHKLHSALFSMFSSRLDKPTTSEKIVYVAFSLSFFVCVMYSGKVCPARITNFGKKIRQWRVWLCVLCFPQHFVETKDENVKRSKIAKLFHNVCMNGRNRFSHAREWKNAPLP